MYCKFCGHSCDNNNTFCSNCGKRIAGGGSDNSKSGGFNLSVGQCGIVLAASFFLFAVAMSILLPHIGEAATSEVVIPSAIFAILSLVGSGYTYYYSKKASLTDKNYTKIRTIGLIVMIPCIMLCVEVCVGPFLGAIIDAV